MTLNLSRRKFIAAGAALATLGAGRSWAATPIDLHTRVADVQLLPEKYGQTRIWGFDGTAPGPEIRVAQGARVQRRVINDLPDATSTHWHGIRIDNAMCPLAWPPMAGLHGIRPMPAARRVTRTVEQPIRAEASAAS